MATATQVAAQPAAYSGVWSWITTVDHKRIGILYGVSAFVFFLIAGIEALIMRVQLSGPNAGVVSAETYNQLFTMHGTAMIFLGVMPFSAAFFNYMVPLLIGARDVAFPRLNAFSFWVFLSGGILLHASFLFNAAPNAGWFGYANLTSPAYSPGLNVDFWLLSLQILGIASLAAAFNFLVTIINMRAPGMSLMRLPLFIWMTLVTSILMVLAFPVITVALTLLLFDRFFGMNFFITQAGADPRWWQHLFWIFGHPEVYILILPAMGIVSEVIPTFSRKPLFGYPFVVYSGIAIAVMSFGVWAHHMFSVGMGPIADAFFSIATMLIAIPTGVKILNWIGTIWGGAVRFTTPFLFSVGFIAMFIIGGLSGVMHASPPADLQQTDTYFVVAHFHYVLFGGSIFGLASGFYYWFPKMTGRLLDEGLGKLHFWLMTIGFNLTFFPMHFAGMFGMPRRVYTYSSGYGFDGYNLLSTIGSFVIAISMLVMIWNWYSTMRQGKIAGNDPWDAQTLEWSISSPPPAYNFARIPVVASRRPFWDQKYGGVGVHEPVHGGSNEGHGHGDEHAEHIHMPNPSYFPVIVAVGILMLAAGLMIPPFPVVSALGLLVMFVGIYGWAFEPAG
jgi:cytochrome c oxidase subunit 1